MNRAFSITPLLLLAVVVACQERSVAPTTGRPSFAVAAPSACPSHADFVVSDEASLLSAVASAHPNDTIALSGMIEMTFADVFVETDDLTFTCATPGSGLEAGPSTGLSWLFVVLSKGVTVERLTLDATNELNGGVVAFNGVEEPFTGFAEDVRLVGNHVLCAGQHVEACVSIRTDAAGLQGVLISGNTFEADGNQTTIALIGVNSGRVEGNTIEGGAGGNSDPVDFIAGSGGRFTGNNVQCAGACLFADGSRGLVVANNQFQSAGSSTGIHLQNGTDGDSVVGNTVVATAPSTTLNFGAMRVRDGTGVTIAKNVATGPWQSFDHGQPLQHQSGHRGGRGGHLSDVGLQQHPARERRSGERGQRGSYLRRTHGRQCPGGQRHRRDRQRVVRLRWGRRARPKHHHQSGTRAPWSLQSRAQ